MCNCYDDPNDEVEGFPEHADRDDDAKFFDRPSLQHHLGSEAGTSYVYEEVE